MAGTRLARSRDAADQGGIARHPLLRRRRRKRIAGRSLGRDGLGGAIGAKIGMIGIVGLSGMA
jgi:hypothetical protein